MSDRASRVGDRLDEALGRNGRGRISREVVRAVEVERGRGVVQAARVDAGAAVTRRAQINTALLTKDEENFIQMAPLGEYRYKAIVDAYAVFSVGVVGAL